MAKLDSLRWFSQRHTERHIWGCACRGTITIKFKLGRDFCTVHLSTKFHRRMFTRSEVIVLTNKQTHKQTDAAENIQRSSLRYDVGWIWLAYCIGEAWQRFGHSNRAQCSVTLDNPATAIVHVWLSFPLHDVCCVSWDTDPTEVFQSSSDGNGAVLQTVYMTSYICL